MRRPPPGAPRFVPTRTVREPGVGVGGTALALAFFALLLALVLWGD